MDEWRILFSGLAALPVLVPIALAVRAYPTAGLPIRLFLFFLVVGLVTDLSMWMLISQKNYDYLVPIFNAYSLVEALFFFWFMQRISPPGVIRSAARVWLALTVPLWAGTILIYPLFVAGDSSRSVPFDTIYEVAAAFISGFALLRFTESQPEQGTSHPHFWLLTGIFFYSFCTFFLMTLLGTAISIKIWWMNNAINFVGYTLYTIAFMQQIQWTRTRNVNNE